MCSGERGGLWRIKNHLREGQTKAGTRKWEFVPVIHFLCVCVWCCPGSVDVCVCLCIYAASGKQCRWFTLSWAFLSPPYPPPHPSSIFVTFCFHPPPHFYPAFTLGSSSKGERLAKKSISPHSKNPSYILFMCQKYWHQPWHNIPEQQSAVCARFHHPFLFFFFERERVREYVEEKLLCCYCPTSRQSPPYQSPLNPLWNK